VHRPKIVNINFMASKYLNIVSVSSEIDPFSKTGGLADVARSLPPRFK